MTLKSNSQYIKGLISVIIPIYGSFDINRAILSIESIKAQKGVKIEIVVSEQGISSKLQSIIPKDIKYIFTKFIPSKEISNFNPGEVRNIGFGESTGEFIYINDADILFYNEYFLQKGISILEQDQSLALHRPPMRRIPLENFHDFYNHYKTLGIVKDTIKYTTFDIQKCTTPGNKFLLNSSGKLKPEHNVWSGNALHSKDPFRKRQKPALYC